MAHEESIQSRQNAELEALQAIYANDIRDLRGKSAWNRWTPLNLSISLFPQQGNSGFSEAYAKVDLHIICSETYPNSVPRILLENSKGLSDQALLELRENLESQAEEFKGEEMIFQLCQYVQEFLHQHNNKPSHSFYDEMLLRQKEKMEEDEKAKQIEETKQRQYISEAVQKRQEILKSESRLRKAQRFNSENSEENDDNARLSISNSSIEINNDVTCEHKEVVFIEFGNRVIQRGQCLKHCGGNHVIFIGIDTETGENVIVSEWIINSKTSNDASNAAKQLASIEQEMNHLLKFRHPNLGHYLNFKYDQFSNGKAVAYILKEFINGLNCSFFMNEDLRLNIQFLKFISKCVLKALDYLHRNNIVHKGIKDTCIYLNDKGNVLLNNFSVHTRLNDLSYSNTSTYSKKTDIYNFGVFLLSLLQGSHVTEADIDIPTSIPSDFYDFLTECLRKDEKERPSASKLLSHSFFYQATAHLSPNRQITQTAADRNRSPDLTDHKLLSQSHMNGQSRIFNEFTFLKRLGKGAFGDVIKVRNKLDDGYYAIKRIQLNPKNRQLNKKIVREVQLLSKLNHENVVRYYNSWIETSVVKNDDTTDSSISTTSENVKKIVKHDEFTVTDNIEELAPPIKNMEVSVTYDSKSQRVYLTSEDESSEEENSWKEYDNEDESDGIEFEQDSNIQLANDESLPSNSTATNSHEAMGTKIAFMYIQMEFCEKSTLRNAIDNNVYRDEDRVWRLFREIVEGLTHIHQQGMIHRDLKPVNIFLDIEDHVKIGDFGLATMNFASKRSEYNANYKDNLMEETLDESKTGLIGTALYVAPELGVASKASYNQKVDIYSLGIIFFEMCYRPFATNMERIKVLTGLRQQEILLPEDFENKRQEALIKELLNHDISKRPTSQGVLQSDYLPPPVLEERELRELVRHTLSNPQLKGYKYLIASCFDQTLTPAEDITYDEDLRAPVKPAQLYDCIRKIIVKVFKEHGGQNLTTPLLMPKSKYYEKVESCVKLMTHFGGIVCLPNDLRVPFARFVAWNGITFLRRYAVERVYREKKVFGFSPRELYECAFDIVTPTPGSLMVDGETLFIVFEIIKKLPELSMKNIIIRLNHSSLLKAILLHFGIKEKHEEIYQMIAEKVPKSQMQTYFINFGLPDSQIFTLVNIFHSDIEISKASSQLQMITRKKAGEASHLAKQALQDLKVIAQSAQAFGVTFDMVVAPGMVYNVQQYSGMICQFVCEIKRRKRTHMEVLAAGGRYDSMITFYKNMDANMLSKDIQQSAVGISLSLDKLVQAVQLEQAEESRKMGSLDVALCTVNSKPHLKEKTRILRDLWAVGIRCGLIEAPNDQGLSEQISEHKPTYAISFKENDQGSVLVQSNRERFQEWSININDLVENMLKIIKNWKAGNQDSCVSITNSVSRSDSKSGVSKSDSKSNGEHGIEASVNVVFVTVDKLSSSYRKRHERDMRQQLDYLFKKLSGYVVVLGITIEANVLRTIGAYLEFEPQQNFHRTVNTIIEKHQRHKKFLIEICDEIYKHKNHQTNPPIILYSLNDGFHTLII